MNCKKAQDYLSPYLDQVLSQEDMNSVEEHLEKCSMCRQELEDLQKTLNIIQTLPELPLPTVFHQELHNKLVAVKEDGEGRKENVLLSSFRNFRYRWASLSMAAVLMVFLYAFLSPLLPKSMEQSDIPYAGTSQNEKKTDFTDNGNLEMDKSQLPERASDTEDNILQDREERPAKNELNNTDNSTKNNAQNSTQDKEIANMAIEEENQEASKETIEEQIRQDTVEAARGKNNSEEIKVPDLKMAAIAPDQYLDTTKEKIIVQYTDFQLKIKKDEYEEVFNRISGLSAEYSDVLDVVYESIDGEEQESFIINVAKGAVAKVLSEINTMGNSVNQDVYGIDGSLDHTEYISIKIIIKEKID